MSGRTRLIVVISTAIAVLGGIVGYLVATSGSSSHDTSLPGRSHSGVPIPPGFPTGSGSVSTGTRAAGGPAAPVSPALCSHASNGLQAATTYISAAESGVTASAQSCVYRSSVPTSVTKSIAGKLYAPLTTDTRASVIAFASTDGVTRLRVTAAKESDGHFYVVGVTRG